MFWLKNKGYRFCQLEFYLLPLSTPLYTYHYSFDRDLQNAGAQKCNIHVGPSTLIVHAYLHRELNRLDQHNQYKYPLEPRNYPSKAKRRRKKCSLRKAWNFEGTVQTLTLIPYLFIWFNSVSKEENWKEGFVNLFICIRFEYFE